MEKQRIELNETCDWTSRVTNNAEQEMLDDIRSKLDASKSKLHSIWSEIDEIEKRLKEISAKIEKYEKSIKIKK